MSEDDLTKLERKVRLRHVETKRQEVSIPPEVLEKAKQAASQQELDLNADHLSILYVCQKGHQPLFNIIRGVNSTRVPVGKKPLDEQTVLSLIRELEEQGFLSKAVIRDRPTWTVTEKARELDT